MNALADEIIAGTLWGKVMQGSLDDPQWDAAGNVHDWRNYVPLILQARWGELDDVARAIAFYFADEAAHAEEWD